MVEEAASPLTLEVAVFVEENDLHFARLVKVRIQIVNFFFMDTMILPGELVSTVLSSQSLRLGPGLRHISSHEGQPLIQATQAGLLQQTKQDFYINYNSHRVP